VATRESFLANHPNFRQMGREDRQKWLARHPELAAIWRRINDGSTPNTGGSSNNDTAGAVNFDTGPPVWDPVAAPAAPAYVPYYGDIDQEQQADESDWLDFSATSNEAKNRAEIDFTRNERDINEEAPNLYRRILNNSAGRGMAFSTGYATQDSEARRNIATTLSDLLSNKTNTIASIEAAIARRKAAYEKANASRLVRRAGRAAGNPYA
jgi:hypothetical protein